MKKLLVLLAMITVSASATAQNIIQNENLSDFHSVSLSGNLNVELIASTNNAIDVQLYDSDVKKFSWSINNNGVLSLVLRPTVGTKARADVRIYYKGGLQSLSVSDAKLTVNEKIVAAMFKVAVSGGGNASLILESEDVEVDATANSAVQISGTTKYLSVRATERSKVDTRGLKAVAGEAEAVTGGEIYIYASERLVATARNASTIYYAGNPTIVKDRSAKTSMGSGVLNIGYKE